MKNLLFITLIIASISVYGQGSVGLVAHWNMNNTGSDASGHGHNGNLYHVTPATGMSGTPNTAYYFDGATSYISVPYSPEFNFTNYSFCATLKVARFYTGRCQLNTIFKRGYGDNRPGNFAFEFGDNAYDSDNCAHFDTTKNVFCATAGLCNNSSSTTWRYSPQMSEDTWYKIIITWDGVKYKVFVNDTLKNTNIYTGSGYFGTSTDSLSIGFSTFDAAGGYPYPFHGIIDDIRIYNRALADSEISQYGDTCGVITLQPSNCHTSSGGVALFTCGSTISTPYYQWQRNTGTGYVNLTNSGPYSGVNTDSLNINPVAISMDFNYFRCIVYTDAGCSDTTTGALLVLPEGVNNVSENEEVELFPNPAHNIITLNISGIIHSGQISILNEIGQEVKLFPILDNKTSFDISNLPAGIYIAKVIVNNNLTNIKVSKY